MSNKFFRAVLIESWGRGIEKICTMCRDFGIPEPEYIVHPRDIMILFKANDEYVSEMAKIKTGTFGEQSQKNPKNYPETTQKTTQKILELIRQNPEISGSQLAEECRISPDGIKWQLKKLKENKVIRHIGPDNGGHWEIIE